MRIQRRRTNEVLQRTPADGVTLPLSNRDLKNLHHSALGDGIRRRSTSGTFRRYLGSACGLAVLAFALASAPSDTLAQGSGVSMVAPPGDGAQYWSRWRGPSGQGVVAGTGYPDTWSETANVAWMTPVPGVGHSSPIVWRDRIFLTTSRNRGQQVSILSFRRSDGELLWESEAPEGRTENHHGKNTPASAACEMNTLLPFRTQPSSTAVARVRMPAKSVPPLGSVKQAEAKISPAASGGSHRCR